MPLAEGQHHELLVAGTDRVGMLERTVDQAVAGADRERSLLVTLGLVREARPREDVEDLLLRALEMQRGRPAAGSTEMRWTPTVIEL